MGKQYLYTGPQAAADVLAERHRQISQEGWTVENDDEHERGELAYAGAAYAVRSTVYPKEDKFLLSYAMSLWPFPARWWKPKDQRRDLVRAAALIIAEIERIDRKTSQQSKGA